MPVHDQEVVSSGIGDQCGAKRPAKSRDVERVWIDLGSIWIDRRFKVGQVGDFGDGPRVRYPIQARRERRLGLAWTGAPGDREHPEQGGGHVRDARKRGDELAAASALQFDDAGSRVRDEEVTVESSGDAEDRRPKWVVEDLEVVRCEWRDGEQSDHGTRD